MCFGFDFSFPPFKDRTFFMQKCWKKKLWIGLKRHTKNETEKKTNQPTTPATSNGFCEYKATTGKWSEKKGKMLHLCLWTFAECSNVFIGCFIHIRKFHVSCNIIIFFVVGFFFLADFPSFISLVCHLAQTMAFKWISHIFTVSFDCYSFLSAWNRLRKLEREREGEKTNQIWLCDNNNSDPKFCELDSDDLLFFFLNR